MSHDKLVTERKEKTKILARGHALARDRCTRRYKLIGVPAVVLSTIVGATALSSFVETGRFKFAIDVTLCVLAILVAVLTALQTFLDYSARAQKHAIAATRLNALSRSWQQLLLDQDFDKRAVQARDKELEDILKDAPPLPMSLQARAIELVARGVVKNIDRLRELFIYELRWW